MEGKNFYDGIILDIDGTIWNTTGIVAVAWNRAIDLSGLGARKVNAQDLQKEFGKTMDHIALDLWPNLSAEERNTLMTYCCTEEHIAVRENTIDIMYPDVRETVEELSESCSVFIVSNCQDGYIELTMEKTGLAPFIKDYECFGRTGKGKAENLQMLVSRNNLKSPVYVGDTLGDKEACAQAKVPFVWAAYGFGKVDECFAKINSFAELRGIVCK